MDDTSMIARALLISAALLTSCATSAQPLQVQHEGTHALHAVPLCSALSAIAPGHQQSVTVSGVFVVGPEHQLFYDPNEPVCPVDVQPETWLEFAPGVRNDELDRIMSSRRPLEETRRAYATFTGELYGPGALGPDDLSLASPLAFANRTRNRRYGHLNSYRTKLVVTGISDVKTVPSSAPWPLARTIGPMPMVTRSEVPRYPEMAWNVGITGDVVIGVTVTGGEVTKAEVRSGDRMLSDEALRNVKTWQFAPDTNATFTTTFTYEVDQRSTGASRAPHIDLQLPARVHITAASNDW